jgi:hypothetical protein
MKKVILTAFAVMASLSLFAQGQIDFKNGSTSKVQLKNPTTGVVTDAPSGSTYSVGLWWAPAGSSDDSTFTFLTGSTTTLFRTALFSGGTKEIDGIAPGAIVAVQVRGWETAAGSYDLAAASSTFYRGKSDIFANDTGNPNATPTAELPTALVPGFNGLILTVPEPSTIALGMLGLAGLFVLRRRS